MSETSKKLAPDAAERIVDEIEKGNEIAPLPAFPRRAAGVFAVRAMNAAGAVRRRSGGGER